MPTPSTSFSAISPIPPRVVSIGQGIFEIPVPGGTPFVFTVPVGYSLYSGVVTPDNALGSVGDWYMLFAGANMTVYQKTGVATWTVETTINSSVANPVTNGGASVSGNIASFNGTTGRVIQDTGVSVADLEGRMQCAISIVNFDATATTTFTDIPGITINVKSGSNYIVEAFATSQPDAVGGSSFRLHGTAHWNRLYNSSQGIPTSAVTGNIVWDFSLNNGMAVVPGGPASARHFINAAGPCTLDGTLTLQFAQQVASGMSRVVPGAYLKVYQV